MEPIEEALQQQRMLELMLPIEAQIALCETEDDQLSMACAMLQRASDMFDRVIGEEGRKEMFRGML